MLILQKNKHPQPQLVRALGAQNVCVVYLKRIANEKLCEIVRTVDRVVVHQQLIALVQTEFVAHNAIGRLLGHRHQDNL